MTVEVAVSVSVILRSFATKNPGHVVGFAAGLGGECFGFFASLRMTVVVEAALTPCLSF